MKPDKPKRKIFDAVDLLTEESSAQVLPEYTGGVTEISIDAIRPFHKHPFQLYE